MRLLHARAERQPEQPKREPELLAQREPEQPKRQPELLAQRESKFLAVNLTQCKPVESKRVAHGIPKCTSVDEPEWVPVDEPNNDSLQRNAEVRRGPEGHRHHRRRRVGTRAVLPVQILQSALFQVAQHISQLRA